MKSKLLQSVMTYNKANNIWQYVGPAGFSQKGSGFNSLAISNNGTLYVAFLDQANNDRLSVMKFSIASNQWQYVGQPGFTNGAAWCGSLAVAPDNTLYVAFHDSSIHDKVSVMKYNQSNNQWQYVGPAGFAPMPLANIAVAPDNSVYIAVNNQDCNNAISVMKFNTANNQWQYIGPQIINNGELWYKSFAISSKGIPYISFTQSNGRAAILAYNASTNQWQPLGDSPLFHTMPAYYQSLSISPDGAVHFAFQSDYNNAFLTVMSYF